MLRYALLSLFSLGCTTGTPVSFSCVSDTQCSAPRTCVSGICVVECFQDDECEGADQCIFNRCQVPTDVANGGSEDGPNDTNDQGGFTDGDGQDGGLEFNATSGEVGGFSGGDEDTLDTGIGGEVGQGGSAVLGAGGTPDANNGGSGGSPATDQSGAGGLEGGLEAGQDHHGIVLPMAGQALPLDDSGGLAIAAGAESSGESLGHSGGSPTGGYGATAGEEQEQLDTQEDSSPGGRSEAGGLEDNGGSQSSELVSGTQTNEQSQGGGTDGQTSRPVHDGGSNDAAGAESSPPGGTSGGQTAEPDDIRNDFTAGNDD